MNKKFYAVNKKTGERWSPQTKHNGGSNYDNQYLVMYDSGYLAIVSEDFYTHIEPLDTSVCEKIIK